MSLVHENPSLSPIEKFQYLRPHFTGDAVIVISNYPLTGDLYSHAYGAVLDRYNNKRCLAQLYIEKLLDYSKPTHSNDGHLQHFLTVHTTASNSFKSLNLTDPFDYIL